MNISNRLKTICGSYNTHINFLKNDEHLRKFQNDITPIGLKRVRIISIILAFIEILLLGYFFIDKNISAPFHLQYQVMYGIMIIAMAIFCMISRNMEIHKVYEYKKARWLFYSFSYFILLWNAGITLLDQYSYGQPTVYLIAIVCLGLISLYSPFELIIICFSAHIIFVLLLPHFQNSGALLLGNIINTTIAVVLACVLQIIIFNNKMHEYRDSEIIQEKNSELTNLYAKLQKANDELEHLAKVDGLTGIYNRMMFNRKLEQCWEKCTETRVPITLIMIDIDYFKEFNDNYGHQAGDQCLKSVSRVLADISLKYSAFAARYGGEEFAVIITDVDKRQAYSIATEIRKRVQGLAIPHQFSKAAEYITVSVGVYTVVPGKGIHLEKFINVADKALYKAKEANRNTVYYGEF